eukprot:11049446-Alexandrium_andersonii.AAC.1
MVVGRFRVCTNTFTESTPQELQGPTLQATHGPAQFNLRTLEAMLRFRQGGLRFEADRSTHGPWADCRLH